MALNYGISWLVIRGIALALFLLSLNPSTSEATIAHSQNLTNLPQPSQGQMPSNGPKIYFSSNREGNNYEIHSAEWNGNRNDLENVMRVTKNTEVDMTPSASPWGGLIYSRPKSENRADIMLHAVPEKILVGGSDMNLNSPQAWSPDGKRITYTSNMDGNFQIYIIDSDGRNERVLTQGVSPSWSPDGRKIAVIKRAAEDSGNVLGNNGELYTADPETGKDRKIAGGDKYRKPTWITNEVIAVTESLDDAADGCLTLFNIRTGARKQITLPPNQPGTPGNTRGGCFFDFGAVPLGNGLVFTGYEAGETQGTFQLFYIKSDGTGRKMLTRDGENLSPSVVASGDGAVGHGLGLEYLLFTVNNNFPKLLVPTYLLKLQ